MTTIIDIDDKEGLISLFLVLAIAIIIDPILLSINAQAESNNNNNNNNTTFLTYQDPQGRFSIDYPSKGWNVTQPTNRFQNYQVQFTQFNGGNENYSLVGVFIARNNMTNDLRDLMNYDVNHSLKDRVPNFEVNQNVECSKYMIDGHQACSLIFSGSIFANTIFQRTVGFMKVAIMVNQTIYQIGFLAFPDAFERNLQVFEKMINSFKITATGLKHNN